MGSKGFVFRREDERIVEKMVREMDDIYRAAGGAASAPNLRPTIGKVAERLSAMRSPIARQKKRYLEALAENALDKMTILRRKEAEEPPLPVGQVLKDAGTERPPVLGLNARTVADVLAGRPNPGSGPGLNLGSPAGRISEAEAAAGVAPGAGAATVDSSDTLVGGDQKQQKDLQQDQPQLRRRRRREDAETGRERRARKRQRFDEDEEDEDDSGENPGRKLIAPTVIPPNAPRMSEVAGMDKVRSDLLLQVATPLRLAAEIAKFGLEPVTTLLLHGPSGCGKTFLANVLAAEIGVTFFQVSGPSLVAGVAGDSEANIRSIFDEATKMAPSLIFWDDFETVVGKRESPGGGGGISSMDMRMVSTLSTCLDRIRGTSDGSNEGKHVFFLAATQNPDNLDPLIRRRFAGEYGLAPPDQNGREQILKTMTRRMRLADDVNFKEIARVTHGFVGGDLRELVRAAGHQFFLVQQGRRARQLLGEGGDGGDGDGDDMRPPTSLAEIRILFPEEVTPAGGTNGTDGAAEIDETLPSVSQRFFLEAAASVLPAAKREGFSTVPSTTWAQVGGMHEIRKKLEMAIIQAIQVPEVYATVGNSSASGILLWGPPGCGKTLIAKAVANESKANFIAVRGPELINKWVGESERAIRELFKRARAMAPCVIFFDEMDALAAKRDDSRTDGSARVVNTLLTELDGTVSRDGIYVIGATNRPDMIDPALRRPGRLGDHVFIGLPTAEDRVSILQTLYRTGIPEGDHSEPVMALLAEIALDRRCSGFSGADLNNLMQKAGIHSLERTDFGRRAESVIIREDWEAALASTKPSTSAADLKKFYKLRDT